MKTLTAIANEENTDKGTSFGAAHGYTRLYERHFKHLREKPVRLLEVGIYKGDSMRMWRRYFPHAEIFGIDHGEQEPIPDIPGVRSWLGKQEDGEFIRRFLEESGGQFDVVIDDGGHRADETVATFRHLWPAVTPGGVYVIEDLHCSYHPEWGGGYLKPGTQIELLKRLIDGLHWRLHRYAQYGGECGSEIDGLSWEFPCPPAPTETDKTVVGLHVYEKIAFIEKAAS